MSLFKHSIVPDYNMLDCIDGFLRLRCGRFDEIKAPIDGNLNVTEDGCSIINGNHEVRFANIDINNKSNYINAGDVIGLPQIGIINGKEMATVQVAILKDGKFQDVIIYVKGLDADEIQLPVEEVEESKPAPKKTTKKKTEIKASEEE